MKSLSTSLCSVLTVLGAALALGGCGHDTSLEAKSSYDQGKGNKHVYDASRDQAWEAAHAAIRWNNVGTITDHAEDRYMITDPTHFDQIGIWVTSKAAGKTEVTVVVIDDPNLPGPNEDGVQKDVATALGLAAAGKPTDKRP
jgi:hypothetical protein